MNARFFPWTCFFLVLAFVPIGGGQVQGDGDQLQPGDLLADDLRLARLAAEKNLKLEANPVSPMDRVYFIKVDVLPETPGHRRQAMVIHYRYRDDMTIFTRVDLDRAEVVQVDFEAHYPTAMAGEEIALATQLARKDERLGKVLTGWVQIEARPILAGSPQDRFFGHRVVHLLLRQGEGYLRSPRVLVDLSTETVYVE